MKQKQPLVEEKPIQIQIIIFPRKSNDKTSEFPIIYHSYITPFAVIFTRAQLQVVDYPWPSTHNQIKFKKKSKNKKKSAKNPHRARSLWNSSSLTPHMLYSLYNLTMAHHIYTTLVSQVSNNTNVVESNEEFGMDGSDGWMEVWMRGQMLFCAIVLKQRQYLCPRRKNKMFLLFTFIWVGSFVLSLSVYLSFDVYFVKLE